MADELQVIPVDGYVPDGYDQDRVDAETDAAEAPTGEHAPEELTDKKIEEETDGE